MLPDRTTHRLIVGDSSRLSLPDASVALVVTSPPYPMITMWDEVFAAQGCPLPDADPEGAFAAQHALLDRVWAECARCLIPGGFLCVNIGDATRTIGDFRLWPNHARVLEGAARAGLHALPDILWRKPTNAPNKFMGSGMLPAGAYVTYEHEYILVLRKGGSRKFSKEEAALRRVSAFFWEERNRWFSDLWELVGTDQGLTEARARSAAFPLEIPARLIRMYSCYGDTVLDPFAGLGTTGLAAAAAARNSVGVEREAGLAELARERILGAPRQDPTPRLAAHRAYMAERIAAGKVPKHHNSPHDVPVVTGQETELVLLRATAARREGEQIVVEHARVEDTEAPQARRSRKNEGMGDAMPLLFPKR